MRTSQPGNRSRLRGIVALLAGVLTVAGLAAYAGKAGAAPQPTLSQVEQKINQLTSQYDQYSQQYDQSVQQVSVARARLVKVDREVATDEKQFRTLRRDVSQIAAQSFEDSTETSVPALLTSNNPQAVLNGASMLLELSGSRNQEMKQFLAAASRLKSSQQQAQRTKDALTVIEQHKARQKEQSSQALAGEQAVKAHLTAEQQQKVAQHTLGAGGGGGGGGTPSPSPRPSPSSSSNSSSSGSGVVAAVTGSGTGQGSKAAGFAVQMAQDKCPYVYGGTGPCQQGFDCSGLAQAAWASAGVSIPRTTYGDWSELPHISTSSLEPGDLLLYDGEGHVAVYVGNGMIVDAPQSGMDVEEISMNESWYASNLDGAVRP